MILEGVFIALQVQEYVGFMCLKKCLTSKHSCKWYYLVSFDSNKK